MKKLFSLLAIAALSLVSASAQFDFKTKTLIAIESHALTITNGATSNYTATVTYSPSTPVSQELGATTVGIQTKVQKNGSGTEDVIFKFSKSVDGVNFETTPSILVTNAANGTTAAYFFNAVTVSGAKYIALSSIVNGDADSAITNAYVKIFATP